MEGEKQQEGASPPLLLPSSSRARPARAATPDPLAPLPTRIRILRGSRGVNKTYWSLPRERGEGGGQGEGASGEGGRAARAGAAAAAAAGSGSARSGSARGPGALVVFFGGDEVAAADSHPDVVRLQTPSAQAAACAGRYSTPTAAAAAAAAAGAGAGVGAAAGAQVVIVVPSRREAGWACFDHFFLRAPSPRGAPGAPGASGPCGGGGGGLTRSGEPAPPGYTAAGLPALSQAASLLHDGGWPFSLPGSGRGGGGGGGDGSSLDVEELKRVRAGAGGEGSPPPRASSAPSPWPPTKVVAFSKGGVVANQLLFELSALGNAGFRRRGRRGGAPNANAAAVERLLPLAASAASEGNSSTRSVTSSPAALPPPHARNPPPPQRPALLAPLVAALAESIDEVVFLDAGLNCRGAYGVTDAEVARGLALLDSPSGCSGEDEDEGEEEGEEEEEGGGGGRERRPSRLRVELVGTPRQWGDRSRAWLPEEKERMYACLKGAGVSVSSELVLGGRKPDLRTHFLGIEAFGRGGGGGG